MEDLLKDLIQELTPLPDDSDDHHPPPYDTPGRILVEVTYAYEPPEACPSDQCRWDFDVLDCDGDTSVFWLGEGCGFDWWLKDVEFTGPGRYLLSDVVVTYIRGDGWMTDDDEEWRYGKVELTTLTNLLP